MKNANTVLLPMSESGDMLTQFAFFFCPVCDFEEPPGSKLDCSGFLFDANIWHYCDDCGGRLLMWTRDKANNRLQRIK